jgi:hypothetical protein
MMERQQVNQRKGPAFNNSLDGNVETKQRENVFFAILQHLLV